MSEAKEVPYIGITIGPIIDTLNLAKTPAMLWYASYLFSQLTAEICRKMTAKGITEEKIISPYYASADVKKDGIGRYHDRIIVQTDDTGTVQDCINAAKKAIIEDIKKDLNDTVGKYNSFFENFFCIHWAKAEISGNENPIIVLGKKLDALEQMPSFLPAIETHPIVELFSGKKGKKQDKNTYIKNCAFLEGFDEKVLSQLVIEDGEGQKFRSIPGIARGKEPENNDDPPQSDEKYLRYFAVVQADVDSMGKYIESLETSKNIRDFSKECIQYTSSAAKIIGDYGGMTIYAGGDDLLFLAPLKSVDGNDTLFDLLDEIRNEFVKTDFGKDGGPTLSFGVAIRYEKFPLYEALEAARTALFGDAKKYPDKNVIVVDFQKHSGQGGKLAIPTEKLDLFMDIFDLYLKQIKQANMQDAEVQSTAKSIIYILDSLSTLLNTNDEAVIKNVFRNMTDNAGQKKYKGFFEDAVDLYWRFISKSSARNLVALSCKGESNEKPKTFEFMLRLAKFMVEKGGKSE